MTVCLARRKSSSLESSFLSATINSGTYKTYLYNLKCATSEWGPSYKVSQASRA